LHRFDGLLFSIAFLATLIAHAAANVYNDVSDDAIGTDPGNTNRIYPYTGGSRFIQTGLLSRGQMMRLALSLAGAALLLGALLAWLRGPGVILVGCAGLGLGVLYSMPGPQLSARGIGEAAVATAFGFLPLLGSVWLQTGIIDTGALALSVPVSAWAAAILVINEVPDIEADRRAGKLTLAVRWGAAGARRIYLGLTAAALAAGFAAVLLRALPVWYAPAAVTFAGVSLHAARGIASEPVGRARLTGSIKLTLAVHAAGCATMILAILLKLQR
jgi:1,4-dihydroxy-2-naphthoate octaprenyltransferase